MIAYSKIKDLETYRTHRGSFTLVRFVNKHGAVTWLSLFDGTCKNVPNWINVKKLEDEYQNQKGN